MTSNPNPNPNPNSNSNPTSTSTASVLLLALLLLSPARAQAVGGNRSFALEGVVAGKGAAPGLALSSGCWLEWELELLARVTVGSAPRPVGRGTAGAVTPELGLRWAPDEGRWRPVAALAAGVRLPTAGRATAPTAIVQGGVERRLGGGWAAVGTVGVRFTASERAAGEAALGLRLDL